MHAKLLFCIGNQSVSNISTLGLLMAQAMGSTQLIGIMHGFNSDKHVTYSEDVVQVHVQLLSGVCMHTPLTLLDMGTKTTVCAAGLEGESPFTLGGLPTLQFDWTMANPDMLQLVHVYAQHPAASAAPSLPTSSFVGAVARHHAHHPPCQHACRAQPAPLHGGGHAPEHQHCGAGA